MPSARHGPGLAGPGGPQPASGLLRAAAGRVCAVGQAGTAAQVAPGEFVILLDGLRAPRDAAIMASRVHDALSQPIEVNGIPVDVAASTGVAVTDGHRHSAEELIKEASSAARPGEPGQPFLPGLAAGQAGQGWPALAATIVPRLLTVGLALQSVSALADGPAAAQLQHALGQLDSIIQDTQAAVLEFPRRSTAMTARSVAGSAAPAALGPWLPQARATQGERVSGA